MKRLALVSSNLILSFEGKENNMRAVPCAELVFVTIEPDYDLVIEPPLIEGSPPRTAMVKAAKVKQFRTFADSNAIKHMIQTLKTIHDNLSDITAYDNSEDEHEPGPEPTPTAAVLPNTPEAALVRDPRLIRPELS